VVERQPAHSAYQAQQFRPGVMSAQGAQASTRRIDLAMCAIMAHSVAANVDTGPQTSVFDEAGSI
jgi:hypothetical protein